MSQEQQQPIGSQQPTDRPAEQTLDPFFREIAETADRDSSTRRLKKTCEQTSRWLCLPIVFAYLVSLALPAVFMRIEVHHSGSVAPGYAMLVALPFALVTPSWWANPVWLFGVIALIWRNLKWAWCCGLVGTLLALSVFLPPMYFQISHMHSGYYVWLGSMIALLATAHRQITARAIRETQRSGGK